MQQWMRQIGLGTLLMALGSACALPASADAPTGFYLGVNGGRSENRYDTGFIDGLLQTTASSAGDTLTLSSTSTSRGGSSWSLAAGYWAGAQWGVEASYLHLGRLSYATAGTLAPAASGGAETSAATLDSQGPALALLGRLPLTDTLEIDVRAGDYLGRTSLASTLSFGAATHSTTQAVTGSSLLFGVGAAYTMAGHWSVHLDYVRLNQSGDSSTGRFSADLGTVGLSYTF